MQSFNTHKQAQAEYHFHRAIQALQDAKTAIAIVLAEKELDKAIDNLIKVNAQ
jgi:hypothetical protein